MPYFTDLADLNLPKTCQMDFPDPDDLLNFSLVIMPDEVGKYNQCMALSWIVFALLTSTL